MIPEVKIVFVRVWLRLDLLQAITQSILGQISNPGTFLESTEQELSFGTKVCRINCIIDGEIRCLKKRPVLRITTVPTLFQVVESICLKILKSVITYHDFESCFALFIN